MTPYLGKSLLDWGLFSSYEPSKYGRLAEWLNATVLKTDEPKGSVGSNPTSSAILFLLPDFRPSKGEPWKTGVISIIPRFSQSNWVSNRARP